MSGRNTPMQGLARGWRAALALSGWLWVEAVPGTYQKFCVRGGFHTRDPVNRSPYITAN